MIAFRGLQNSIHETEMMYLWHGRLLVSLNGGESFEWTSASVCVHTYLNEDLSNPNTATAVSESLLHGLSRPHDGDSTDLSAGLEAREGPALGSRDRDGVVGDERERRFNEETDDPVAWGL